MRDNVVARAGKHYRLVQQSGKAKLDVRFADGSRKSATLPFSWEPASARDIEDSVVAIAGEVAKGRTLKESIALTVNPSGPSRAEAPSSQLILQAWSAWGAYKVQSKTIKAATWNGSYKLTQKHLESAASAPTVDRLLHQLVEGWDPGSRVRQIAVQRVTEMLRWATDEANGPMLDPQIWQAPPKGGLERWTGKTTKPPKRAVDLTDVEIQKLINCLPVAYANHPMHKRAAERWQFAFQLMAAYGLRPDEIHHLEVRDSNGKDVLWCSYSKRSGGGASEGGRLWSMPPEWEEEWDLVQRIKAGESLPEAAVAKTGDQAGKYLKRQEVWQPMADRGCTPYSFRHAYSRRCHHEFEMSVPDVATMMRHSVDVHTRSYSHYFTEKMIDLSIERSIKRRALTESARTV